MGWKWFPTVAWMCDESFAINVSTKLPDDVDEKWFYFHVSWLNYIFWVVSTLVGGLFGDLLASVEEGKDIVVTNKNTNETITAHLSLSAREKVMIQYGGLLNAIKELGGDF